MRSVACLLTNIEGRAILLTIIEACSSPGIDPKTYLRDLLARVPAMTTGSLGQGPAYRTSTPSRIAIYVQTQPEIMGARRDVNEPLMLFEQ